MARGGRGGGGGGGGADVAERKTDGVRIEGKITGDMKADAVKAGGRSPTASPTGVATPCRAGRRDREGGGAGRGAASTLEELVRRRGVDEAWNALAEMQRQGQTTDKFTVSRMLMKTVGDGRLNPARVYRGIDLVEKFIETQPKDVDEVLFNALLDTCCRLKDLTRLEATMKRMRELKVNPSPVTLGILVKTYGQAGDLQKVLQVWNEMEKQRGQANAVTYGCMIDACVKCGHLEKAVEIFKGMRQVGKHRNTILYTTLIKGYGLEKALPEALELFREMPKEDVPYNTITYNSIIDACIKCGDLATGEQLLREMTAPESNLEPDLITFSTLLKGYCHVGDIDKALQVAEAIKARGLRKDELVYNTLMDGCVKANDITAGVGLFEEMVQQGMRPSAITHSILVRLYQRAGYEEDASEAVAQLYQHHKIERPQNGDRSKGLGKKGWNQRSSPPSGSSRQSPLNSPTTSHHGLPGVGRDRSDSCWSMTSTGPGSWGENGVPMLPGFGGLNGEPSASEQSTPMGSPMGSPMTGGGAYLPIEAVRPCVVPPMPGHGASSHVAAPFCGASPLNMDQSGVPLGAFGIPNSPQANCMTATPAIQGQAMPTLPQWPFACNGSMQPAMGMCATVQGPTHGDGSLQFACGGAMPASMGMWSAPQQTDASMQFPCGVAMSQPTMVVCVPAHAQGQMMTDGGTVQFTHDMSMQAACQAQGRDGSMQQHVLNMPAQAQGQCTPTAGQAGGNMTPSAEMPQGSPRPTSAAPVPPAQSWQGKPADMQSTPFPMPLSPPHDLAYASFSGNQQSQAYFESWAPEGQQMGPGAPQLIGLPMGSNGNQGPSPCPQ